MSELFPNDYQLKSTYNGLNKCPFVTKVLACLCLILIVIVVINDSYDTAMDMFDGDSVAVGGFTVTTTGLPGVDLADGKRGVAVITVFFLFKTLYDFYIVFGTIHALSSGLKTKEELAKQARKNVNQPCNIIFQLFGLVVLFPIYVPIMICQGGECGLLFCYILSFLDFWESILMFVFAVVIIGIATNWSVLIAAMVSALFFAELDTVFASCCASHRIRNLISDTMNLYFKWEKSGASAVDSTELEAELEANRKRLMEHGDLIAKLAAAVKSTGTADVTELDAVLQEVEEDKKEEAKAQKAAKEKKAKANPDDEDGGSCCNKECIMKFKCLMPLMKPIMDMLGIENPLEDMLDGALDGVEMPDVDVENPMGDMENPMERDGGDDGGDDGDDDGDDDEEDEEDDEKKEKKAKKKSAKKSKGKGKGKKKSKWGMGSLKKGLKAANKLNDAMDEDGGGDDDGGDEE